MAKKGNKRDGSESAAVADFMNTESEAESKADSRRADKARREGFIGDGQQGEVQQAKTKADFTQSKCSSSTERSVN